MLRFQKNYFVIALFLFLLLVFIARYIRDSFIRPYGGDLLVVIFLYCLVRSFFTIPVKKAIFWVLLFSFLIEGLQYLQIIKHLGLEKNTVAVAILGSHFEWLDLLLYSAGGFLVLAAEMKKKSLSKRS